MTMEKKRHFYKNGNGRYISLPATLLITLITIIISIGIAYGTLVEKDETTKKDIEDLKNKYNSDTYNFDNRIIGLEKSSSATEVSINEIKYDITELKTDLDDVQESMNEVNKNVIILISKLEKIGG